jgi:hypothetical protein
MVATDETVDEMVWAEGGFEPCFAFVGGPGEPGVCVECGWLADEHADDAEIVVLPAPRRAAPVQPEPVPVRKAS